MTAEHRGSTAGALLLVSGTSIGAGMLALPVITSVSGFWPSLVVMTCCWAFMTSTALLLLEANLWVKEKGVHTLTLASHFLGPVGKWVACLVYLFIGYASLVAYISSGGELLLQILSLQVSKGVGYGIFAGLFGLLVAYGARLVSQANGLLVVAMIVAYCGLVGLGLPDIQVDLLNRVHWPGLFVAAPLFLTVFSFQCIVPSLTLYLQRDRQRLRRAIIGGTSVTFVIYLTWQLLVLGTVPFEGPFGLEVALQKGLAATEFYRKAVHSKWVAYFAETFSFCAIVTSFLGVGLGLFDFLSDGLKVAGQRGKRALVALLVIVPSFVFAFTYPRAFLVALDTSGGLGDSILNGILPVLMVWVGRYYKRYEQLSLLPGGRFILALVFCFAASVLSMELFHLFK